jgi:hypothetical protein
MGTNVLFLDFDDVICLSQPFGAYDAMLAMRGIDSGTESLEAHAELWAQLFVPEAVAHLKEIHNEFELTFVLSTSWIKFLTQESLICIMRQSGLSFVADSLHEDWSSTRSQSGGVRANEIRSWLDRNPGFEDRWVILDDLHSGTGLDVWNETEQSFITLCKVGVGLTEVESNHLRKGLQRRWEVACA